MYLDGIYLKKNWGGTIENIAVLVSLGVNSAGNREIIGAAEGREEEKESWLLLLRSLKERGIAGVRPMAGDKCLALVEAIKEVFHGTEYQRCIVHFMRNKFCNVPRSRGKDSVAKLKAIFAQEDRTACLKKAEEVAQFQRENKMKVDSNKLEACILEALTYTNYPHEHGLKIRSNNGIERINREIRRCTNTVGAFPDGNFVLMLICARLRFVSASEWDIKTYHNMERVFDLKRDREAEQASVSA